MQNYKAILPLRHIAVIGFLSCFFLFVLTVTVHCHTAAIDHAQHECALCLLGIPSKALVVSLPVFPVYYAVRALFVVAASHCVSLPIWDTTSSRSPPPLA
jgi:hypothetical protein